MSRPSLSARLRPRISRLAAMAVSVLLIVNACAAFNAYEAYVAPVADISAAPSQWRAPTSDGLLEPAQTPQAIDAQTLARPVFSKSRRPWTGAGAPTPAAAAASPSEPALPERLTLAAIVVQGKRKAAFVVSEAFPEGKWLRKGDTLQDWTIADMRGLAMTLKNGGRTRTLLLDYAGSEAGRTVAPAEPAVPALDPIRRLKGVRG